MEPFVKRIITVVISLFLIAYVGYQAYQVFYNPVKTETVTSYSMYDTIDAEGITIRSETRIAGEADGFLFYTVENGSRVSKGGVIAQVFPTEADALAQRELDALNQEIASLKEIQLQGTANRTNLDVIDKQISQLVGQITEGVNSLSLSGLSDWHSRLLELLNKRQITVGTVENFDTRLAALNQEKASLEGSFSQAVSSVTSPEAGYFVSEIDGFEETLKVDDALLLTPERLTELMESTPSADSAGYVGKVVRNYEWYFACLIPAEYAASVRMEMTPTLLFPFVTDEPVSATVVAANRDKEGNTAVVFECVTMSSALSSMRVEPVQIRLQKYEGLRVPSSCIIKNEEGEYGVYALVGDTCTFRRVNILHSEPEYVICEETDKDGYLKLYDDIITEGKGLYDGKTVR
ncbi:MAG TPA: hypothetical protein H9684_06750 [Firmicutes bacterium]|nr:hypothetical protein [Bacillota bacterium]